MAQNWTDNVFDPAHVGQTDLQNMENNFACLKSCFSGSSAPANPVPGMLWVDTTNHVLKIRNEANNAWFGVWDLANDKPYGQDFTDGDYLDGDKIDIDFNPASYTPDGTAPEADDDDDLAAHLKGIDQAMKSVAATKGMLCYVARGVESEEFSVPDAGWATADSYRIYIPSNMPNVYAVGRIKRYSELVGNARFRIVIGSSISDVAETSSIDYVWVGPVSISDLTEGWYTLSVQLRSASDDSAQIQGWTVIGGP